MSFVKDYDVLEVRKIYARRWQLLRPIKYIDIHNGEMIYINVPEGFITDFASVPRPFWIFTPPDGKYTLASVVHDYLCIHPEIMKRKAADELFMKIAKQSGVNKFTSYIMFAAIRFYRGFIEKLVSKK